MAIDACAAKLASYCVLCTHILPILRGVVVGNLMVDKETIP